MVIGGLRRIVEAAVKLPSSCAPGQMPVWSGTAWVCGSVGGGVATAPPDIDCGSGLGACSHGYAGGAQVTVSATHEADVAAFLGWSGACSGTDATCQVAMDQARQVTAIFLPTLSVNLVTSASSRDLSCVFGVCILIDTFTDSHARVTVSDLDTSTAAGTCDADTTAVVAVSQFSPPRFVITTCHIPAQPGHHLSLQATDSTVLGGNQTFTAWSGGGCDGVVDPICTPAAPVTVHDEVVAGFNGG